MLIKSQIKIKMYQIYIMNVFLSTSLQSIYADYIMVWVMFSFFFALLEQSNYMHGHHFQIVKECYSSTVEDQNAMCNVAPWLLLLHQSI